MMDFVIAKGDAPLRFMLGRVDFTILLTVYGTKY